MTERGCEAAQLTDGWVEMDAARTARGHDVAKDWHKQSIVNRQCSRSRRT